MQEYDNLLVDIGHCLFMGIDVMVVMCIMLKPSGCNHFGVYKNVSQCCYKICVDSCTVI